MFILHLLFFIINCVSIQTTHLPLEEDLENYIDSLKGVTEFYEKHSDLIDINVLFGLFITNVNLERILKNNEDLSASTKDAVEYILQKNNKTTKHFIEIANKTLPDPYRTIATFFANSTLWVKHLHQLTKTQQKSYSKDDLLAKYGDWEVYKNEIKSQQGIPDQYMSNHCLAALVRYPINNGKRILVCPLEESCNVILKNGTDIGYALSHRILWMLAARYGRGCSILSSREDKQLEQKLCAMAFAETEYIFINNSELADLMFEFICICALGGHSEYLHKHWLDAILDVQTNSGCFKGAEQLNLPEKFPGDVSICNHHTTALSACSISAAVRYVLEK